MRKKKTGRTFRVFDRLTLRGQGSVNCRPVESPEGIVVAVNENAMYRVRLRDGKTGWYSAEELERREDGPE